MKPTLETRFIAILLTSLVLTACATKPLEKASIDTVAPQAPSEDQPVQVFGLEKVAKPNSKWIVLDHKYFTVYYDPSILMPRYVEYTVTAKDLSAKNGKRKDELGAKFHPDKQLKDLKLKALVKADYTNIGYDRGHMAPANDFIRSQEAMNETFVMSNMAPQKKMLNEHAWESLESLVHGWACGEGKITVISGPIFTSKKITKAGKIGIPVPDSFFKIVIDETVPRKAIGFIYDQNDEKEGLHTKRVVSISKIQAAVDERFVQELSGLDESSLEDEGKIGEWRSAKCVTGK